MKAALFAVFIMLIILFFSAQYVGRKCDFNPLLGNFFSVGNTRYYPPWAFLEWYLDPVIKDAIPLLLKRGRAFILGGGLFSFLVGFYVLKQGAPKTSHGTASWASKKDIDKYGLADGKGVIIGINPFTHKLLAHDGPEHILLMAPTRSGKGVGVIIPTCLMWQHSLFVLDVKSENYAYTATFRKQYLHQKVIKFAPLSDDGSSAKWNPLAEVNLKTPEELNDVMSIVSILVNPSGETTKGDPFWADSAASLLQGIILHLLYAHEQMGKPLPTISDIITLLSGASGPLDEVFKKIKSYPHISKQEFFQPVNPLQLVYGEYIYDLTPYRDKIGRAEIKNLQELKLAMMQRSDINFNEEPWCYLLTHPKANEMASNMIDLAPQTRSGVISTVMADLKMYQNPIIKKNTSQSDFVVNDLLDPKQALSFYLCIPPQQLDLIKPLCRMLINLMLDKLIRDLDLPAVNSPLNGGWLEKAADITGLIKKPKAKPQPKKKKQRLLFMLDEFPQFGNFQSIERALAVCAGYGLKMCIVAQDINQLNKAYTKENSILSNCHVRVFYTPNDIETCKSISEQLGSYTITTSSRSDGGGLFKGSNSYSETKRELMTPDEVARMDREKHELVFVSGQKTIKANKLHYFKWKFFTQKCLPPPLYSDKGQHQINDYKSLYAFHAAESKWRLDLKNKINKAKAEEKEKIEKAQRKAMEEEAAKEKEESKYVSVSYLAEEAEKHDKEKEEAEKERSAHNQEPDQRGKASADGEAKDNSVLADPSQESMTTKEKLQRRRMEAWLKRNSMRGHGGGRRRPMIRPSSEPTPKENKLDNSNKGNTGEGTSDE